jgi:hypothetical protein
MPPAYAGLIGDLQYAEVVSKLCETAAGVGFGFTVSRGTSDDQAVLGGTSLIGVTVRSLDREGAATTAAVKYNQNEAMGVIKKGYVWINLVNTGSAGAAIYSVDADGTIAAGTAGAGQTQIPNATLETTVASAGDLALIRVDF